MLVDRKTYVEIKFLPLSFSEWCDFCNLSFASGSSGTLDEEGNIRLFDDVFKRERNASKHLVSDPDLLRTLCEYLADTVGNQMAATKIANTLTSAGRKTTHSNVSAYIKALMDAYIVYPCSRYDIHGKSILKTQPKRYLVDTGLVQFLGGYRRANTGFDEALFLNTRGFLDEGPPRSDKSSPYSA